MKPLVSIITPTYNRADLLERAFQSLLNQSNYNFEWIIIDDGSQDITEEVVKQFETNEFLIYYYKKENGGKHTALNYGIKQANGAFILMLDSDDLLPIEAIETVQQMTTNLPQNIAGVVGRKSDLNNEIVGSKEDFETLISNSLDIRYKYGVVGDLTEVFRTDIFKTHLFPEIENEKFCPEVLVWNRIAKNHNLLFFNKSIYIADYQSGGLTDKITRIRMQSPKASMLTYSELGSYDIPLKEKIKANINFWRFSFNDNDWSFNKKLNMNSRQWMPVTLPLGFLMYLRDKLKSS